MPYLLLCSLLPMIQARMCLCLSFGLSETATKRSCFVNNDVPKFPGFYEMAKSTLAGWRNRFVSQKQKHLLPFSRPFAQNEWQRKCVHMDLILRNTFVSWPHSPTSSSQSRLNFMSLWYYELLSSAYYSTRDIWSLVKRIFVSFIWFARSYCSSIWGRAIVAAW